MFIVAVLVLLGLKMLQLILLVFLTLKVVEVKVSLACRVLLFCSGVD